MFGVYAKGWINSKRDLLVVTSLSLIDKTEDPGSIILTTTDGFGEASIHIFLVNREKWNWANTYFPEYAKLFIIPVDVLAFPFKGNRKIEAKNLRNS